jgi:diguanylate cyclase (GGDEF)-like protein
VIQSFRLPSRARPAEAAVVPLLVAGVCVVAIVGIDFRNVFLPRFSIFNPIAVFTAALCDASTAAVLLETWRHSYARRSTFVLALSFAVCAILAFLAVIVASQPGQPAILRLSMQAPAWLYVCWHISAAAGAFAYIILRRDEGSTVLSRRFAAVSIAFAALIVGVSLALASSFADRLPILVVGNSFRVVISSEFGSVVLALLTGATLLAFRIRGPTMIDRTVAVAMLSLTLDSLLLFVGSGRFSGAFYASRALLVAGSMVVLVSAVQALIASRSRLVEIESTLAHVEGEAARRAGRIRALWQIAANSYDSEEDRFRAMLDIAAATIRPGKSMFGGLSHREGNKIVVDAISGTASGTAADAFAQLVYPGLVVDLGESILNLVPADGGTRAWDDLSDVAEGTMSWRLGWRSFVGTPLTVGERTFYVTFGSPDIMSDEPFAEDDIAFVEVVASFLANSLTQQFQYEQIKFEIEHDALTGLDNRAQFRKAVREEIAAGRSFAIAFVDLDGFRHVNEREGYQTGDEMLVEVARGLVSIADGDLVTRMSADEFGILMRRAGLRSAAAAAITRYAEFFLEPLLAGDHSVTRKPKVGASIGVSRFPDDGDSVEELVRRAAVALDVAKSGGGSTTTIFDTSMEAMFEESQVRLAELNEAFARDQFALVYQPTFDLASREFVGAEALVRWDHPVRGRLSPAEFLGFAERNGLMGLLSRWVLARVTRDVREYRAFLPPGFRVYFNLTAQMLDDVPFISKLNETLRETPGLSEHLGVEVTETAAMENVERSMYTIELFRRWGLSVAIDDFGTGYSSLSYLKQLTVDVIKIDRSFVMGLPADERDAALTEMLLRITDRFGFVTLAEGIETEAQAAWLLAQGCRLGQGYLIAKPGPFEQLVRREKPPARIEKVQNAYVS